MPASQDYGWARLDFGQKIGRSERYTIERKLGWGMHSSTWLARDTLATKFVAVKVLTGYWTDMCRQGVGREPEMLRHLEELQGETPTPHCMRLFRKIEDFLVKNPPQRHDPEMSEEGIVQSAVSQKFPPISMEDAAKATYLLADFGCAQASIVHSNHTIIVVAFRPPEVFLKARWDTPADIWAFGCQIFELLTGVSLFTFEAKEEVQLSEVGFMLYQMSTVTGDRFEPEFLKKCSEASDFFEPDGSFKGLGIPDRNVAYLLKCSQRFNNQEELIAPAAALINRALRIDPDKRATAEELLKDPWFEDVV
ncbi:kinase-like protein [Hymenopellis radicata]|nr:kinase-like protein [Hymenopellis radicata]